MLLLFLVNDEPKKRIALIETLSVSVLKNILSYDHEKHMAIA